MKQHIAVLIERYGFDAVREITGAALDQVLDRCVELRESIIASAPADTMIYGGQLQDADDKAGVG